MVGKRKRSLYRKSRKKLGFWGLQKQECEDTEILRNQTENVSHDTTQSSNETDPDATETVPLRASRRKLSQHEAQYEPKENENTNSEPPEHRFVDMQRLSTSLSDLHKCEDGKFLFISFRIFVVLAIIQFLLSFCLTDEQAICFKVQYKYMFIIYAW